MPTKILLKVFPAEVLPTDCHSTCVHQLINPSSRILCLVLFILSRGLPLPSTCDQCLIASVSLYSYVTESEAFTGEALVLGEISYSLVFGMDIGSFLSSNPKNIYFFEDSPGNKHYRLAKQSQIISYSFISQPIECADQHIWEVYAFHVIDFNRSSNKITI